MPPLIVAVAAAAAAGAVSAAVGGVLISAGFVTAAGALSWGGALIAGVAGAVVAAGVGYGLSAAFGLNRVKANSARAQDRKQTIRSSVAPRQVIYGTARVSGPIVYASSSGDKKQFLHLVVPLAGHRVTRHLALWINDTRIPRANIGGAGDNGSGFVTLEPYFKPAVGETPAQSFVRFRFFDGSQTTAWGELVGETSDGWSASHVLRETAYFYIRLEYDRDVFGNGPGALSVEVEGKSTILDPRTNTVGWSNNPALCILDYLTSADGLACSADEIDTASFIAAANVCDEMVPIAANGTTQKRYTLDGAFTLDASPLDIIDDMLTSCAGTLVYVQGRYRLYAGAYDAPTDTLTASDLAGQVELVTKPPRRELFNTVRGTFIHPGRNWQASEFPAYSETALVTADGETITRDVEWPFTTDEIRAQRLAKLTLRRAREALTVRVPVKYAGLRYCVWQTLNVTLADFGWTNKPFRIVAFAFDAESGIINLTLREESANSYAWQFGDAQPLPLAPDTDLVDPLAIPAPISVAATASTTLQPDGSVAPALLVTWTSSAFAFLSGHEVQWRVNGAADWNSGEVPVGTDRFFIAPVIGGTTYEVRARGISGIARGAWSITVSGAAAGDTTAPGVPTGLAATGITRGISLTWTLPTAPDLAAVEVWENTTSSTSGRYFVGETRATGFVRTGLAPSTTRHFWVRSRDFSNNTSAFSGSVSATSAVIVSEDIADNAITAAKIQANAIDGIQITGSVIRTNATTTRVQLDTAGNKLTVLRNGSEIVKIAAPQENTLGVMSVFPSGDAFGIASVGTGAQIVGLVSSGATGPAAVSGLGFVTDGSRIGVRGTTSLGVGVQGEAGDPIAEGSQGVGVLGRGVVGVVGRGRTDNALPGVRSDRGSDGAAGLGTMQAAAYNNFTGAHLDLIAKDEEIEPGDIVVPAGIFARVSVLDALIYVARSTGANQPAAGVFIGRMALTGSPLLVSTEPGTSHTALKPEYADLADTHDLAHHAALGEGCMSVCGEGGDIAPGDLIVTSSIPGKGMRKADNAMDSTVVAKARESMTFTGPTDVQTVAVAFLCG